MIDALPLLNKKEAAAFLKISSRSLDRLHEIPRVRLTRSRVAFRAVDLAEWAASRLERPAWRDADAPSEAA